MRNADDVLLMYLKSKPFWEVLELSLTQSFLMDIPSCIYIIIRYLHMLTCAGSDAMIV